MNTTISISTLSKFLLFSSVNDKICATLKKIFDRMTPMNLSYIPLIFQLEFGESLPNKDGWSTSMSRA